MLKSLQIVTLILFFNLSSTRIWSVPTDLFWTNCITDVLATGTGHIDIDSYFSLFKRNGHGSSLPLDTGFLLGIFTWHDLNAEAGIDYLGGTDDPFYFNGKVGMSEDKLFANAPSFSIGVFDIGTRANKTNINVVNLVLGRKLPESIGGTFYVAGFIGNRALGKDRQGYMVGYSYEFCPEKDCSGKDYHKWEFAADYASGNNLIGGGGFGMVYRFTPEISLEGGPVWFNTAKYNGSWKWSIQLDINFPVFNKN